MSEQSASTLAVDDAEPITLDTDTAPEPAAQETVSAPRSPASSAAADDPAAEAGKDSRAEAGERGRPVGQWVAGGGLALGLGGLAAWSAFGPVGLAAAAVTAAGGGLVYAAYRLKNRSGRRSGAVFGKRGRGVGLGGGRRSTSRLGQVGLGKGRAGRLGGKGGAGLGKHGRGGGLGGKLGRRGTAGRGLLGGKGSRPGGKAGLGLGRGRGRSTGSRLGGPGRGRGGRGGRLGGGGRAGGGLLGRAGRAGRGGLGLGVRGGRSLAGKGRAGFGRWGQATGSGALHGFRAAKAALNSSGIGKGQVLAAHRAARSALRRPRACYRSWEAELGAALLALMALLHRRWKARRARQNPTFTTTSTTTTTTSTTTTTTSSGDGPSRTTTSTTTTSSTTAALAVGAGPSLDPPALSAGSVQYSHFRRRNPQVSTNPILTAAAEMNAVAASYAPENPFVIARELDKLPDVTDHVALAIRTYTQRLDDDYPLHPAVISKLKEVYAAQAQLRSLAEAVGPLYRQVHAKDLEREEAPRRNEHLWNV
jgi:hypothetical protein